MILRLDVDAGRRPLAVGTLAWLVRRAGYRVQWLTQTRSPSGRGWHVEVQLIPSPRDPREVTALQAILGSDRAREACNLQRARTVVAKRVPAWWRRRWNVLYQ